MFRFILAAGLTASLFGVNIGEANARGCRAGGRGVVRAAVSRVFHPLKGACSKGGSQQEKAPQAPALGSQGCSTCR